MVCIAAFIILCFLSVFVAILSIFKRDLGKRYWKTFKKAWGCVFTKLKLQKCETNFKEDIKNSVLSKVVIKHPKAVKPLSVGIEIASVLIVVITVWSLVVGVRSGLSLLVFGSCDITKPDACAQASVCVEVDQPTGFFDRLGRWFAGWGDLFTAIPDRLTRYNAEDFITDDMAFYVWNDHGNYAIDVFDPGCDRCLQGFRNQLRTGFFDQFNTVMIPYPMFSDGHYKFASSGVISRYLLAAEEWSLEEQGDGVRPLNWRILERLFTEYDDSYVNYQSVFNNFTDEDQAAALLDLWLADFGLDENQVTVLRDAAHSDRIAARLADRKRIADEQLNGHGLVPISVYNGRKHIGTYRP
jgi:hypothetical protein